MKLSIAASVMVVAVSAAACGPPRHNTPTAQQQAQTQAPAGAPSPRPTPSGTAIDPQAIAALDRMGVFLRTLQDFEVRAKATKDEVLTDTEQKVQFGGEGLYRIHRPNAFFLQANTDRKFRQYFYDGHTFTIFSPRMKVYAQRPAPATIREMVDQMEGQYQIPVPLSDLFEWGADPSETANMKLASYIGFATVGGQPSDQYLFRQGDLDWQVWIARGDKPVPLKVVITTLSQPEQPQYTTELTWNLQPRFSSSTFAFHPPSDAHAIQIASN